MRVQDCTELEFELSCRALADLVGEDFAPDLIVGIESGGAEVLGAWRRAGRWDADFATVGARRPGTERNRRLARLLGRTPRPAADLLRQVEHVARLQRFERGKTGGRTVTVSPEVSYLLGSASRVLVVDDAVDSGQTLAEVLTSFAPSTSAEVRTAVLTMTFPRPLVVPDYALHRGVLLRFPWSSDHASSR